MSLVPSKHVLTLSLTNRSVSVEMYIIAPSEKKLYFVLKNKFSILPVTTLYTSNSKNYITYKNH